MAARRQGKGNQASHRAASGVGSHTATPVRPQRFDPLHSFQDGAIIRGSIEQRARGSARSWHSFFPPNESRAIVCDDDEGFPWVPLRCHRRKLGVNTCRGRENRDTFLNATVPLWLRPIVLLFVAALLVSCSPGSQLSRPDAATLLQRSAQYMSSVTSMHASLEVDGPVTANPAQRVLSAEGVVQQSGGIGEVTATFDYAGAPTTSTYLFREGKSWM